MQKQKKIKSISFINYLFDFLEPMSFDEVEQDGSNKSKKKLKTQKRTATTRVCNPSILSIFTSDSCGMISAQRHEVSILVSPNS